MNLTCAFTPFMESLRNTSPKRSAFSDGDNWKKPSQKQSKGLNLICCCDVWNTLKINRTAFIYTFRSRIQSDGFSLRIPGLLSVFLVSSNFQCRGRSSYVPRESLKRITKGNMFSVRGVLLFSFIRVVPIKNGLDI